MINDPEIAKQIGNSNILKDAVDDLRDTPIDKGFNKGPRQGELQKPMTALDVIQALTNSGDPEK